jgi:ceramide glucosyltransferase
MRTALILAFVVLTGTGGELCLSHAMKRVGEVHRFSLLDILRFIAGAARQVWMWIGIVLLALAFYGFLAMFSWYPVSFVIPATSLSYITGALGARFLLGERLSAVRWAGILLISLGVALAWGDQTPALPAPAVLHVLLRDAVWALAVVPLLFYFCGAWAAWRFFGDSRRPGARPSFSLPPASILKPVRGADRNSYDNFASFCRQDYPAYEVLFAVGDEGDTAVPVIRRLMQDFPGVRIGLLVGAEQEGANDKAAKLCRLSREARNELLVIADSDVRVAPGYLRSVAAPFADPNVGVVTALYRTVEAPTFGATMDAVGSLVSFSGLLLVARALEGISVAMGSTVALRRERLEEIGGFAALLDVHADDYEIGRRLMDRGYRIELAAEPVGMDFPAQTFRGYLRHQLRWLVSIRNIRPGGHLALLLMHGLPWCVAAALLSPSRTVALGWLAAYLVVRLATGYVQFVWGLRDPLLRRKLWLLPLQDFLVFFVWLASFAVNRIEWRGLVFTLEKGRMVPVASRSGRE